LPVKNTDFLAPPVLFRTRTLSLSPPSEILKNLKQRKSRHIQHRKMGMAPVTLNFMLEIGGIVD